jgi:hypothetical protein
VATDAPVGVTFGVGLQVEGMDIAFKEEIHGKRLFRVFHIPDVDLFVGTMTECRRYVEIYSEKVHRQLSRKKIPKPQINRQCRAYLPLRFWDRH